MTLHFLADHPHFNVARLIGLPVSDELFVQLARGVEILLGLLLISGALPQLVASIAAVPFTATLPFLGIEELIGNLPIYGVLLALLILGSRPDTAAACAWLPRPRRTSTPSSVETEDRSPVVGDPVPRCALPTWRGGRYHPSAAGRAVQLADVGQHGRGRDATVDAIDLRPRRQADPTLDDQAAGVVAALRSPPHVELSTGGRVAWGP
jgi:hypothetical protein